MGISNYKKRWILVSLVAGLLLMMTYSDLYYSALSENYPVLRADELIEGRITGFRVHHKHTFVEIDSTQKRNIPPSFLIGPKQAYFHQMIAIGDYFKHADQSDKIAVSRDDGMDHYIVSGLRVKK